MEDHTLITEMIWSTATMRIRHLYPVRSMTGSNVSVPTRRPTKTTEFAMDFWYVVRIRVPSG